MATEGQIDRFLTSLTGRHARLYSSNVSELFVATATNNESARRDSLQRLGEVIRQTMGVAEVLGATLALRAAAGLVGRGSPDVETFAAWSNRGQREIRSLIRFADDDPTQSLLPNVTFLEAVSEMVTRAPVTLHDAAERTALRIAQLYSEERVAAFVKSADEAVTERVQGMIAEALRTGEGEGSIGARIVEEVDKIREVSDPWSEAYARMAFRTNVNTAVTAGRFRQVQDPDVRAVIPAFQFQTAGPSVDAGGVTRTNHAAANGLIFTVENPVWNQIAPLLGYSCRCGAAFMSLPQLRRLNRLNSDGTVKESRLPSGAHADEGFRHGGRPDLFVQGVI